jgi:uncharacterized protein (DUF2252 family)
MATVTNPPGARASRPGRHLTVDERTARGRAARADSPRSGHADWQPAPDRRDPVEVLQEQAATRVPDLVPIRYGRMLTSPFAFFRGAAALMAMDLAGRPTSGIRSQLCGDAHLSNFGFFASPERSLVFSVNDFDESLPGPWEWDLKRLAASFAVSARQQGVPRGERAGIVTRTARAYRLAMRDFSLQRDVDVWYARADAETVRRRLELEQGKLDKRIFEKNVAKARAKDAVRALERLTERVDGALRFRAEPPLIVPIEDLVGDAHRHRLESALSGILATYRRSLQRDRRHLVDGYRYVDLARKVVGVGSVGTRAWIVLLVGRDEDDPLVLQVKEAQPSVLEAYLGRSEFSNQGQRVVEGQRLMQSASDIFLGWTRTPAGLDGQQRDFYVRQLWDWKRSVDVERMGPSTLAMYGELCAWTLARAHARSGDRVAIGVYLGNGDAMDRALAAFAERYADQNERDFAALEAAVADGRVTATMGL